VTDGGGGPLQETAELVSKLTHEIRGPVSTIRGLAGTTLAHYDRLDDVERREFLELIRHEADRLERAVEHVAMALKLDANTLRFDIRPQDLSAIVRSAAETAETGEHPLDVDVGGGIEARVDSIQVAFVVRQLVENAATFSPPGSPISVSLRRDGGDSVIEITDRGPGIPPDRREAVFERFADWRPPGYEDRPGTGLGLFLCRAILQAHGGEASIADGPAGGTMLTVRLPTEERLAGAR
jgi:two-component system sensor histidine kinase KdpD